MSKPNTPEAFSKLLDDNRIWRMKEISDLRTAIRQMPAFADVLCRAHIPICYAHWEGHVKFAATKYIEYVSRKKLPYGNLQPQFLKNRFLQKLGTLAGEGNPSITRRSDLVGKILDSQKEQFAGYDDKAIVNTKSNLNSDVLKDICLICGISFDAFESEVNFIDSRLLDRRNNIAHGQDTSIGIDEVDEFSNTTIELMKIFGQSLEEQVSSEFYKIPCDAPEKP